MAVIVAAYGYKTKYYVTINIYRNHFYKIFLVVLFFVLFDVFGCYSS